MLRYKIIVLLCFAASVGYSQQEWRIIYVDTLQDRLYYNHETQQQVLISKEGVELARGTVEGSMSSPCGCRPRPNGIWINRYRNGNLKSVGEYRCETKIGTWTYYHENGNLAKVETLQLPYLTFLTEYGQPWDTLKNRTYLRSGAYAEYYENGRPKITGQYEIVEAFSEIDTLRTLDTITYGEIKQVIKGQFWIPQSVKTGVWKIFNEQGVLVKSEEMAPLWNDPRKYRGIESRYFELFFKGKE